MKIKRISGMIGLIVVASVLASCSGGQNPAPTTDPKLIYTQVAETVQAQATQTAAAQVLTPKSTNTPLPTDVPSTLAATNSTVLPSTSGTKSPVISTLSGSGTPGLVLPTLAGVPTSTGQAATAPDKMLYVSQTVADGTKVAPGTQFTQSWVLKNVGTTTWNSTYRVRFYGGNRLGVDDFEIGKTIAPNSTITLTVQMTAPDKVGQYNSLWVLTNNDGVNFGFFTLGLEVK
jgi:hypothetical protein